MTRIVYNVCYGGFSISKEAQAWLQEKYPEKYANSHLDYCFDQHRHHPHLLEVIDALGLEKCSGECADLAIEEHDGPYSIKEYDGNEDVITAFEYPYDTRIQTEPK